MYYYFKKNGDFDIMKTKKAVCYGMCSGVKRALTIVDEALKECQGQILYIYHEIVHNTFVINALKKKNVIFANSVEEIPCGARVVFSAHGVSAEVEKKCREKNISVYDATCLLVKKNHRAAENACSEGKHIVFIGRKSHPECTGIVGRVPDGYCFVVENEDDIKNVPDWDGGVVSIAQTTLSVAEVKKIQHALKSKYPQIENYGGICFATTERQNAIKELSQSCDLILIAGSEASSNSKNLLKTAQDCGVKAYLVDNVDDIKNIDFKECQCVGISAGASTPQEQIDILTEAVSKY